MARCMLLKFMRRADQPGYPQCRHYNGELSRTAEIKCETDRGRYANKESEREEPVEIGCRNAQSGTDPPALPTQRIKCFQRRAAQEETKQNSERQHQ